MSSQSFCIFVEFSLDFFCSYVTLFSVVVTKKSDFLVLLELAMLWPIISGKGIGGKQTRHASIINRKPRERRLLFHFFYNAFLLVVSPQKKVTMENFRITKGNWPVIGYYFSGLFFHFAVFPKKLRKHQTIFPVLEKPSQLGEMNFGLFYIFNCSLQTWS